MSRTVIAILCLFWLSPLAAEPMVKVKSVKRLTHLLSNIEKSLGVSADFTTLRLQLHLEDVYISQGSTLYLDRQAMTQTLAGAIQEGLDQAQIAERLLRAFQKGDFSEI